MDGTQLLTFPYIFQRVVTLEKSIKRVGNVCIILPEILAVYLIVTCLEVLPLVCIHHESDVVALVVTLHIVTVLVRPGNLVSQERTIFRTLKASSQNIIIEHILTHETRRFVKVYLSDVSGPSCLQVIDET